MAEEKAEDTPNSTEQGGDDAEAAGEKTPINNVDNAQVRVATASKPGCFLTRTQAILLAIAVLLIIIVVAVLAAVLSKGSCSDDEDSKPWLHTTPRPTVNPKLPWSDLRLPRHLIPSRYNITLKVDLASFKFSGSVDIDVDCKQDTSYVIIHANSLDIRKSDVTVMESSSRGSRDLGGKKLKISEQINEPLNQFWVLRMGDKLRKNKHYLIRFGHFEGEILDDLRGLYKSTYTDAKGKKRYLAASQLQSVDARKVFPCFDEPDLKANFTVAIVHKQDYTALSNMPVDRSQTQGGGWVKDQFLPTPLMSTYLLAFVVAEFEERRRTVDGGLVIRIFSQPDMYDQTKYALSFAEKAYSFFDEYFATKEIVPKADHVAIPDFSAGAMENWGLVLYRETALLHDDEVSSISNKYWVSLVMAHEIAHTWFGNMVTMKWWDDLWLNEGFANTLMYFALDHIYESWNVFDLQLVNNIYPVMTKDSLLTSHAISTPIVDPDDIPQYFDSISYDKGMAVLRLLRGFLGWEDFKRGLQKYVTKYKFKNAEMSELWQTFAEVVNHKYKVGEIMDTWTRQMGFPVVTVSHISGKRYRLEQERFLLNPDDKNADMSEVRESRYGYKWHIPFSYMVQTTRSSRERGDTKTVWLHMDSAEIQVQSANAWLIGNVDYMGFYRTNYDLAMWGKLTEQLNRDHTVFSPANRAGLISDAFNLARANKLSYEIAFNLTSYLDEEEDYVPWRAFLDSMDFVKGMLSSSNSYGLLKKFMFDLVAPKYRKVGTSDQGDLLERNLRRVVLEAATGVDVPDAIQWAERTFNDWQEYNTRIPPDYAAVVFAVGIHQGTEQEWNHLWDASQKTLVASESEIMMNALAYTQEPWLLWRYARWSLDSSKIRMQDIRNLFRYFAHTPLGRSVALQFLLTNWREINERFGMDAFLLRDIIHATTSLLNTDYEYEQLLNLYRDYPPAGVASKAADNSLALIKSNIKWTKSNHDTIHSWLKKNVKSDTTDGRRDDRRQG